jgi:hypothetical protein
MQVSALCATILAPGKLKRYLLQLATGAPVSCIRRVLVALVLERMKKGPVDLRVVFDSSLTGPPGLSTHVVEWESGARQDRSLESLAFTQTSVRGLAGQHVVGRREQVLGRSTEKRKCNSGNVRDTKVMCGPTRSRLGPARALVLAFDEEASEWGDVAGVAQTLSG